MSAPIPLADAWDRLKVAAVRWWPDLRKQSAELASGQIVDAALGEPLWRADVTLPPAYHADAAVDEAVLSWLQTPGVRFLAADPRYNGPRAMPNVAFPGVTLASIAADRQTITLGGFTGAISPGDMLSVAYGTHQFSLHRAVTGATNAGSFRVTPYVRFGVNAGAAVELRRPVAAFKLMVPDFGMSAPLISPGASFSMVQALR